MPLHLRWSPPSHGDGREVGRAGAADGTTVTDFTPPTLAMSVLVGNPRTSSRTLRVARQVAHLIHEDLRAGGLPVAPPALVDLSGVAADLADWESTAASVREATTLVCDSHLTLVVSPTFKAGYTGLLKLFLDRLPRRALTGTVAVPVMTAAAPGYAFAVDTCLRPVLVELGATVPVPGLTILEEEFDEIDPATKRWREANAPILSAVLST